MKQFKPGDLVIVTEFFTTFSYARQKHTSECIGKPYYEIIDFEKNIDYDIVALCPGDVGLIIETDATTHYTISSTIVLINTQLASIDNSRYKFFIFEKYEK